MGDYYQKLGILPKRATTKDELIVLTEDQKNILMKRWQDKSSPPSIMELIKLVFPDLPPEFNDGRNRYGKAIKGFLAVGGLVAKTTANLSSKKSEIILTDSQKEYITNNCSTMKALELTRFLFNNVKLNKNCMEFKAVSEFLQTLPKEIIYKNPDDVPEDQYNPPTSFKRIVNKINKYVNNANLDSEKLTPTQKKQCEKLMGYLHNFRLVYQIDMYNDVDDKTLFESAFIEHTWDKADLSSEDVDQYIVYSTEKVMASSIQKHIVLLQDEQERTIEEEGRMSMQLVESIKSARTEYDQCIKRQNALLKSLTEERSKRLSEEVKGKSSLLTLFELVKHEESRVPYIKALEEKKKKYAEEINRLDALDDIIFKVLGLGKDEMLNG